MKNFLLSFIFLALIACNDQNSDDDDYSEWLLDKKYDFIVGVLSADSLRDHPQEIFVGKAKPNVEAPPVALGEDEVMNRVLLTMRQWYFAEITGKTDAEVWVEHENAEKVQFTHIEDGIYRDINNNLNILPTHKYKLTVNYDDKVYSGNTVVPGGFDFLNVDNGDSLIPYLEYFDDGTPWKWGLDIKFSEPSSMSIYKIKKEWMEESPTWAIFEQLKGDGQIYVFYALPSDTTFVTRKFDLTVDALDSNYAFLYRPGETHSASEEFFEWYDAQNAKTLGERSTVYGGANVGGVFGSFNRAKVTFYVRLPKVDDN